MFLRKIFARTLIVCKGRNHSIRSINIIHDKNFDYFRYRTDYKNLVVALNNDLNYCKLAGPGFSFLLKEHSIPTDGLFYNLLQRENVMRLSTPQIKDIMCLMANTNVDTTKYSTALKYLDEKCALSTERWSLDLSLYILDAWFIILGPKAFRRHYYTAVTSMWTRKLKKCTKFNLVLMLYFIGMSKSAPPFLMEMLQDKMESIVSEFSDEEWAIVCLSFFKISKRIDSVLVLKQSCKVAENLLLKDDRFHLISILKFLRLSKYFDAQLQNKLKEYILKENSSFNFVECTNFLASFAAQNIYDKDIFDCLETQGISVLLSEKNAFECETDFTIHPSVKSRVKDIARFLWTIANVGHSIKENSVFVVNDLLKQRLNLGEFESQFHVLIDCLQSLVLLGYYPQDIFCPALNTSILNKIYYTDRAKPRYQLYFIQKSILIEHPDIHTDQITNMLFPIPKILQKDIKQRKGFKDVVNFLNQSLKRSEFMCGYVVPHIMIAGIIVSGNISHNLVSKVLDETNSIEVKYQKYVENGVISKHMKDFFQEDRIYTCIEILDPSVCVQGSTTNPIGLMKTKIRQLKQLKFNVITLFPNEIDNFIKGHNLMNENIADLIPK